MYICIYIYKYIQIHMCICMERKRDEGLGTWPLRRWPISETARPSARHASIHDAFTTGSCLLIACTTERVRY